MAKGKNAEKRGHCGKEYWSRRLWYPWPWGKEGKKQTHRAERREAKKIAKEPLQ